jgi:four helix bundle protein
MRDHTSLVAWQVSRAVASDVYRLSVRHWSPPAGAAFTQLQRAALSVSLNLAEGYAWRAGPRWRHHLRIAYGSAVETTDILDFLLQVGVAPAERLSVVISDSKRAQALILGLLHSARR